MGEPPVTSSVVHGFNALVGQQAPQLCQGLFVAGKRADPNADCRNVRVPRERLHQQASTFEGRQRLRTHTHNALVKHGSYAEHGMRIVLSDMSLTAEPASGLL